MNTIKGGSIVQIAITDSNNPKFKYNGNIGKIIGTRHINNEIVSYILDIDYGYNDWKFDELKIIRDGDDYIISKFKYGDIVVITKRRNKFNFQYCAIIDVVTSKVYRVNIDGGKDLWDEEDLCGIADDTLQNFTGKFKPGDKVKIIGKDKSITSKLNINDVAIIKHSFYNSSGKYYYYSLIEDKNITWKEYLLVFYIPKIPKFHVGDIVRYYEDKNLLYKIIKIHQLPNSDDIIYELDNGKNEFDENKLILEDNKDDIRYFKYFCKNKCIMNLSCDICPFRVYKS